MRIPFQFITEDRLNSEEFFENIAVYSSAVFSYLGHSGLIKPWHEFKYSWYCNEFRRNKGGLPYRLTDKIYQDFLKMGVSEKAYMYLISPISELSLWESPFTLFGQVDKNAWVRDLSSKFGQVLVEKCADFLERFFELHVEVYGNVMGLSWGTFVSKNKNSKGKRYLEGYYKVIERISSLEAIGVDPLLWLDIKFSRALDFLQKNNSPVNLSVITNKNCFDLPEEELIKLVGDSWREIKDFLGLPTDCEFVDNCVPKGWLPATEDPKERKGIAKVTKDGYYYYYDGTQRRGRFHYMVNPYLIVSCTKENFKEFKSSWHDARLVSAVPTWEEYSQYGVYNDVWDLSGNSGKFPKIKVRWRKAK